MDNKLYESLNRLPGLFGIAAVLIFVIIIIFIFIVRIFQFPHLRQQYFSIENTQSVSTRIFKIIVILLLTAGLIGVISYNLYKMIHDPPKLSVTVEKSEESPSMLICPTNSLKFNTARYYTSFNSFFNGPKQNLDLNNDFKPFQRYDDNCTFFNSTSSSKIKDTSGGFYLLGFTGATSSPRDRLDSAEIDMSGNSNTISIYIGDTNNEMNWNLSMPQGNKFSDVGFLISKESGIFQYTETCHKALNGSYRGFQIYSIGSFEFSGVSVDEPIASDTPDVDIQQTIWIGLIAPINVITQVEEPSLTLADFLSNVGGYLSIWGIFGFLFGNRKVRPFGFVSRFVFMKQDMAKLHKELGKMKGDESVKLSNLEREKKDVYKMDDYSNQSELKNLLAKYYVDMDFYEHAIKYA